MKTKYFILSALAVSLFSCTEKKLEPISDSLGKPGIVEDVEIENTPGGANVKFRIPNAEDILAVKAVYTLNDQEKTVSASYFENHLEIKGYNDEETHKAKLYVINRAQELSDPVEISFDPLESPLSKSIKSVNIISDFGGAQFNWRNPDKAPLTVQLFAQDSIGQVQLMKILSTEADTSRFSLRGYAPEPRVFCAVLADNFGNQSDTIYPPTKEITPFFEEKLNKKKMVVMKLSNDANFTNWEGMDSYIIDDNHDTFGHSPSNSLPAPFTVDLGTMAKLSRIVMFQRKHQSSYFNWGNPMNFEVYTTDKKPSTSGDWSEWTKIMDCKIIKPSGSPSGTVTDEDMAAGENGHEFTFELSQPPMRYVRIVILDTWGGSSFTHPADVDFYGTVEE